MNEVQVKGKFWMKAGDNKKFELTLLQDKQPILVGGLATVYIANQEELVLIKEVEIVDGVLELNVTKEDDLPKGVYDIEVYVEELDQTFPESYYLQLVVNKSLLSRVANN